MVSTIFVEHYKDVYPWWVQNVIKYDHRNSNGVYNTPMCLEVRNDGWTDELLEKYSQMLEFIIEYDLEHYHGGDIKELTRRLFDFQGRSGYVVSNEICRSPLTNARISCAIQSSPVVRLGDLALIPCHRTGYPEYEYGNFIVEDNKIVGISAKNWQLALKIYSCNPNISQPKCSGCDLKYFCMRGCIGSQYESTGELFAPIESVCNLMHTKFATLYKIFTKYNMYNIIYDDESIDDSTKEYIKERERALCQIKLHQ